MNYKSACLILTIFFFDCNSSSAQELLPTSTTGQIVRHTYYTLSYSEKDEQPEWVYYTLTAEMLKGKQKRTNDFRQDTLITSISAQPLDYKHSGYDLGHLCPAQDMKLNKTSMSESFLMSNMSPQKPSFNRGIWKKLEAKVRKWAITEGRIYVVTGGILTSNKGKIGLDGVSIPKYFYKVVYDPKGQGKMIALLLPNEKGRNPLQTYVVSVDSVESLTGIDFFPELPDTLENLLERNKDLSGWSFSK
jgi:endonuclease G